MDHACLDEHVKMEETLTARGGHSHIELTSVEPMAMASIVKSWEVQQILKSNHVTKI
jgi:hypothetical protein